MEDLGRIQAETRRILEKLVRYRKRETDEEFESINSALSQIYDPSTGGVDETTIPPLNGDVSGPITANVVEKIQGIDVSTTNPTDGQVLTYDSGEGHYEPRAVPDHEGDVTGPHGATVVEKIQGIAVSGTNPTDGQVLTFDAGEGHYEPRTPTGGGGGGEVPDHEGDVTGPHSATVVAKVQGIPFSTTNPTDGQSYVYDADLAQMVPMTPAGVATTRWEPLTNGDPDFPELIFTAEGDVIMVEVPI
jgi:hypothetical protein